MKNKVHEVVPGVFVGGIIPGDEFNVKKLPSRDEQVKELAEFLDVKGFEDMTAKQLAQLILDAGYGKINNEKGRELK